MQELEPDLVLRRATDAARRTGVGGAVSDLRRLEGGVSSLTYAGTLATDGGDRPVVLKVAPPGLEPVRNRDVLRQARLIDSLHRAGFTVPGVLFDDAGDPPGTPPLFAMELAPGESYEPLLDVAEHPPTAEIAAERMRVAVRALAQMHSYPLTTLGIAGEPVSPVTEELDRWRRLFATVDEDIAPGHEELAARLAERTPADAPPALLHGDYRVANMLFTGTTLQAVIDWEIWSVGDPRSDLAWVLMHAQPAQVFHEHRSAADVEAGRLVPTVAELVEEYAEARRRLGTPAELVDLLTRDLGWFLGVCYYKTASTIAVIWKRERKRDRPDPKLRVGAAHLQQVLAAGHDVLDSSAASR